MSKRPRTEANKVTFRVRGGVIAEGVDPILSFLEIPTASGEPVYDLRRTFELADGRYEFDAGVTRGPIAAFGKSDFFPELNRPSQRQHQRKTLRRRRSIGATSREFTRGCSTVNEPRLVQLTLYGQIGVP